MLVDYYTIYFDDSYLFNINLGKDSLDNPPKFDIIHYGRNINKEYLKTIDTLKDFIKQEFPSHSFVGHRELFDYKIDGGIIFGTEIIDKYSIYEYLFSNEMRYSMITVLE